MKECFCLIELGKSEMIYYSPVVSKRGTMTGSGNHVYMQHSLASSEGYAPETILNWTKHTQKIHCNSYYKHIPLVSL